MKIQVLHDKAGTICAVFAPTAGSRKGGIEATGDTKVIEADVPEVTSASDAEHKDPVSATIVHVLDNYEVRDGRLVERSKSAR